MRAQSALVGAEAMNVMAIAKMRNLGEIIVIDQIEINSELWS